MVTLVRQDKRLKLHCGYENADDAKRIAAAVWNKREGCWEFPLSSALFIIEVFPRARIDESAKTVIENAQVSEEHVTQLVKGTHPVRKHAFLMKHQRVCRELAVWAERYALFLDTGTGKTLAAYSIIADKPHIKWVVVCPKSIVKTAWMEDHTRWFPHLKVLPLSKNIKKVDYLEVAVRWGMDAPALSKMTLVTLRKLLLAHANIVVINPESFKTEALLDEFEYEGLIVDESSIMRNMKSQITVALLDSAKEMRHVYLLSGKPAPNNELEYFPQMLAVNPALFGGSFYKFRDRYFRTTDYFGYNFTLKDDMKDEFARRLAKSCIFVSKKECLDLPDEMPPVVRMVEMSAAAKKYYKEMEHEHILMLDDRDVAAKTKLSSMMKLRQITSGFIIDTDDDSQVAPLHRSKLEELKTVVEELGDNKAMIWINFKREATDIVTMLEAIGKTVCTAYSQTKDVDQSILDFKSNKCQFIVAHPKTLKYGVTFTGDTMIKNCTYAIYYSMSYSYEDYYQSHDRIYRKGQSEGCTYIFLVAEDTIDEDIYDAIIKKGDEAAIMENMIRRCHNGNKQVT